MGSDEEIKYRANSDDGILVPDSINDEVKLDNIGHVLSKKKLRQYKIIRYSLLAVLLAIVIALIIAIIILLVQVKVVKKGNSLICNSVCGCGFCYYLEATNFETEEDGLYSGIQKHLKTLKNLGVGSIILVDNGEIHHPENEAVLEELAETAYEDGIQIFYHFNDLGSVDENHEWIEEIDWVLESENNSRRIINYGNRGVKETVIEIVSKYIMLGISGISVGGLPLQIDSYNNNKLNYDLDIIKDIKSDVYLRTGNDLYIIFRASGNELILQEWKGEEVSAITHSELNQLHNGVVTLDDFIYSSFNGSYLIQGLERVWTYDINGFSSFQGDTNSYLSIVTLSAFLPNSFELYQGNEFRLDISGSYENVLNVASTNPNSIIIGQHMHNLQVLHETYFKSLNTEIYSKSESNDIYVLYRTVEGDNLNGIFVFIWNRRNTEVKITDIITHLENKEFKILIGNENIDKNTLILAPFTSAIIRFNINAN